MGTRQYEGFNYPTSFDAGGDPFYNANRDTSGDLPAGGAGTANVTAGGSAAAGVTASSTGGAALRPRNGAALRPDGAYAERAIQRGVPGTMPTATYGYFHQHTTGSSSVGGHSAFGSDAGSASSNPQRYAQQQAALRSPGGGPAVTGVGFRTSTSSGSNRGGGGVVVQPGGGLSSHTPKQSSPPRALGIPSSTGPQQSEAITFGSPSPPTAGASQPYGNDQGLHFYNGDGTGQQQSTEDNDPFAAVPSLDRGQDSSPAQQHQHQQQVGRSGTAPAPPGSSSSGPGGYYHTPHSSSPPPPHLTAHGGAALAASSHQSHALNMPSFLPSTMSGEGNTALGMEGAAVGGYANGGGARQQPMMPAFMQVPPYGAGQPSAAGGGNGGAGPIPHTFYPVAPQFNEDMVGLEGTDDVLRRQQQQQQQPPPLPPPLPGVAVGGSLMNRFLSRFLTDLDDSTNPGQGPSNEPRPVYQTRFGNPADDLPLLEELGIFPRHIWRKALAVLNPFRAMPTDSIMDTDLAGPVVFAISLAFLLSLQGKVKFSAIYGLCMIGIILFKALLALMNDQGAPLQFVISSLGYALMPSLLLAILRTIQVWLFGSLTGLLLPASLLVIVWSSWCATSLLVKGLNMEEQRFLILYPMCLFYAVFAALTLF